MAESPSRAGAEKEPSSAPNSAGALSRVVSLPANFLRAVIWVYQRTLSPALVALSPNAGCRFAPSCSHYAREALQRHGCCGGLYLTTVRLSKCGPWHPGGEDPVPRQFSCFRINPEVPGKSEALPSS